VGDDVNLGYLVAQEANVRPEEVMLLRHSNRNVAALRKLAVPLEAYSLVQPTNSKYDFLADERTKVRAVAVIVDDKVYAVYKITGIEETGTTYSLLPAQFRKFDEARQYEERPARRFSFEEVKSISRGKPIAGWTSPRSAVARYGGRLFEKVEVL
jgi:hypothetical protein